MDTLNSIQLSVINKNLNGGNKMKEYCLYVGLDDNLLVLEDIKSYVEDEETYPKHVFFFGAIQSEEHISIFKEKNLKLIQKGIGVHLIPFIVSGYPNLSSLNEFNIDVVDKELKLIEVSGKINILIPQVASFDASKHLKKLPPLKKELIVCFYGVTYYYEKFMACLHPKEVIHCHRTMDDKPIFEYSLNDQGELDPNGKIQVIHIAKGAMLEKQF